MELEGIHHVSALTADGAANVAFYTRLMGMRLVKKTVNQDDTSSYHLFYGDERGGPGTELTFFDIPGIVHRRPGYRSISEVGLRVRDVAALDYWRQRFDETGVRHGDVAERSGRPSLLAQAFEGLTLVLTADEGKGVAGGKPWERSPVPAAQAVYGLGPVTLTVADAERTTWTLTEVMGFHEIGCYASPVKGRPDLRVFSTGEGGAGAEIHLETRPELEPERLGRGGVHHVAFRVQDDAAQQKWLERLREAGLAPTGIIDRFYFKSIYFREPSGILFELATDGPGFVTDEDFEHLGERLALPPFLEPQRASIEAKLHPLEVELPG